MATNYQRGAAFERQVKKELEAMGLLVVRSAGSKGPVDLIAVNEAGGVLLIQCKVSSKANERKLKATKRELKKLADKYNASAWLALKYPGESGFDFDWLQQPREG